MSSDVTFFIQLNYVTRRMVYKMFFLSLKKINGKPQETKNVNNLKKTRKPRYFSQKNLGFPAVVSG